VGVNSLLIREVVSSSRDRPYLRRDTEKGTWVGRVLFIIQALGTLRQPGLCSQILSLKKQEVQAPLAHACNSSYLGG
jgi:hypothetical protein